MVIFLSDYSAHAWQIISEMSHATEITTSFRGDVTNKPSSFVLCSFQIIEPAVAVSLNALDFTVCLASHADVLSLF